MMNRPRLKNRTGSILILALWALGLLTVFTVNIGVGVRQKMTVLSRLIKRDQLQTAAASGIRLAQSVFYNYYDVNAGLIKHILLNSPSLFQNVPMEGAHVNVSYWNYDFGLGRREEMYGLIDEDSKVNINTVDRNVLLRLLAYVTDLTEEEGTALANAIIDWRAYGESEIEGFYSSAYYERLEYPYQPKKEDFETIDELLLVQGMTEEVFDQLFDFITVYGPGQVNVNTASRPVLAALGLSDELIDKVLYARRGADGLEATFDDFIFTSLDSVSHLASLVEMNPAETSTLGQLISIGQLGIQSFYFRVTSRGRLSSTGGEKAIVVVLDSDGKIVYWREREGA